MAEKLAHILKKAAFALLYILGYLEIQKVLFAVVRHNECDVMNYSGVVTIIAAVAMTGVLSVVFYLRDIKWSSRLKFKRLSLLDVILSFTLAIGFRMVTCTYFVWAKNIPMLEKSIENSQQTYNFATMTNIGMIAIIVSMYFAAPIFEEILFRAAVQKELSEALGPGAAIVLQAVMFGCAHGVLVQGVFAAVYAVVLGVLYFKTKNIAITILAHMFFNMSSLLKIKSADMLTQMAITGFCITALSMFLFFYAYRRKRPLAEVENPGGNSNG